MALLSEMTYQKNKEQGLNQPRSPFTNPWDMPFDCWCDVEPLLRSTYPVAATGRPRNDFRSIINCIVYRLETGCPWNYIPENIGSKKTAHRWYKRWVQDEVFEKILLIIRQHCPQLVFKALD